MMGEAINHTWFEISVTNNVVLKSFREEVLLGFQELAKRHGFVATTARKTCAGNPQIPAEYMLMIHGDWRKILRMLAEYDDSGVKGLNP